MRRGSFFLPTAFFFVAGPCHLLLLLLPVPSTGFLAAPSRLRRCCSSSRSSQGEEEDPRSSSAGGGVVDGTTTSPSRSSSIVLLGRSPHPRNRDRRDFPTTAGVDDDGRGPPSSSSPFWDDGGSSYDPADAFLADDDEEGGSSLADLATEALMMSTTTMDRDDAVVGGSWRCLSSGGVPDLDGNPLTTEYLSGSMGIHVESYSCPLRGDGGEIFRGFMSNGCRLRMLPGGETAFYKSIVFEQLGHAQKKLRTAPFKLRRDARSYEVVAKFLSSDARREVCEVTGIRIPGCYHSDLRPDDVDPIKTRCSFLMEDLSPDDGWYQSWLLRDRDECEAVLTALAKIHAFFWTGSSFWRRDDVEENGSRAACDELEDSVWESGSYVQPTAQDAGQCQNVAREWKAKRRKFEAALSSMGCWDDLGDRLQRVAEECGRLAHPFADCGGAPADPSYSEHRTFTHGDPKQANFLFRRGGSCDSPEGGGGAEGEEEDGLEVGIIDFQWAGFGLAATDVAHFLTSAVDASRLEGDGEGDLLRHYFGVLQAHLVEYGACESKEAALEHFGYGTFLEQYEIGVLDICRLVIAYTWDRFDRAVEPNDKAACDRTMNKTSYNKSIPNVVWLVSRCDEILKTHETKVAKTTLLR